ncbi:hypothetical protein BH20ACT4_BH20ACT4_15020 [soil metagenome]
MRVLRSATVAVAGFTACSEFASFAFVHPVVRRLPPEHHIAVEQGLLRTYGRVMPVLMPLTGALVTRYALKSGGGARRLAVPAAIANGVALASTVAVNVPINAATARWNPTDPPPDWRSRRQRWETFQAVRSPLLLASFVLLCASLATSD